MNMAVEIDKKYISELLNLLKAWFPATLPIYGVLRNISLLESDTSEVWVDKWPEVGAVLISHTSGPGQFPAIVHERKLFATKAENATQLLKNVFVGRGRIDFAAANFEIWECIKEAANLAGYQADVEIGITDMYYIKNGHKQPTGHSLPPGFRLESLRKEHAPLLNADWPFSLGKVTERYFEKLIEMSPSAGIFGEGSDVPVAFIICYENGSIGNLHVNKDYRRRGFATVLMWHLIGGVRAKGLTPHTFVLQSNTESAKLHDKMGFTKYERQYSWIECVFP